MYNKQANMDNFDLKKYLSEGKIYEQTTSVYIHKFTNKKTGDTIYSPSKLRPNPAEALKHMMSIAQSKEKRGEKLGPKYSEILKYKTDDAESELVLTSNLDDYKKEIADLEKNDLKSIGDRVQGSFNKGVYSNIEIPKDDSVKLGDDVYVSALYLQRNPDFKKRVSPMLDKVSQNIPGKGSYFKINIKDIKRV